MRTCVCAHLLVDLESRRALPRIINLPSPSSPASAETRRRRLVLRLMSHMSSASCFNNGVSVGSGRTRCGNALTTCMYPASATYSVRGNALGLSRRGLCCAVRVHVKDRALARLCLCLCLDLLRVRLSSRKRKRLCSLHFDLSAIGTRK